jgi:PBSX family phage terminase large subunit
MDIKRLPIFDDLKYIYKHKYRYYIYKGGRGGGKSHHIAINLLIHSQNRSLRILCTRETQSSIKDSVHKLLTDYIKKMLMEGFTITENSIRYEDAEKEIKSEFLFKGLNDINFKSSQSIKSLEGIDIAWIEEAQSISKQSLSILLPTIRKENSCLIFSYNPETIDDPVSKEFIDIPKSNALIKHVNYYDNIYLDKQQVQDAEDCKINKPNEYNHVWLGQPKDISDNSVIKNFTDDNIRAIKYYDTDDLHITCDFNKDPMCWILAHKTKDVVLFFDELCLEHTITTRAIQEFIKRYGNHKGKIIINGDASGNVSNTKSEFSDYALMLNELRNHFHIEQVPDPEIRNSNPSIMSRRVPAWNERILTNKGERLIYIDPKCKWLIYNCKRLKIREGTSEIWEATSNQKLVNPDLKYLVHPFDAASYLVEYYFPIQLNEYKKPEKPYVYVDPFFDKLKRKAV